MQDEREAREDWGEDYGGLSLAEKLHDNIRGLSHVLYRQQESRGGQKRILTLLARRGTISQRTLLGLVDVKSGSLSEVLGKLEAAGLIRRAQNQSDKRSVDVSITEIGAQVEQDAREQRAARLEKSFACLSEAEQRQLLALTEKLNAAWREE